jgi:signal transduction histidine kinase/ligand-binding sensor domain-containing protein/DNA-binding response OmpR family regulator
MTMKKFAEKLKYGSILIVFFYSASLLHAQTPVSYLGINQGLSNNSVRCILRDHKGFMWFGTFDGLNRYDGYNFKVFRNNPADTVSLINSFINALSEDKNGLIWVGTRKGGCVYHSWKDKFIRLRYLVNGGSLLVDDVVKTIQTDWQNNVFVGTENKGLLFFHNGELTGRSVPLITNKGTIKVFGVQSVKMHPDKNMWVFVQNQGLCLFDYRTMSLTLINSAVQSASSMEFDGSSIWIGTAQGMFEYNTLSRICTKILADDLSSQFVSTLRLDQKKDLWIGTTGDGINIWNKATKKITYLKAGDSKYSLSSGNVSSIYEDGESRKWIGTAKGGVNIIDPQKQRFQIINHDPGVEDGFKGSSVSSFYELSDDVLWIGTDEAGINIWDRKKNSFRNLAQQPGNNNSLPSNAVTSIQGDGKNIWAATFSAGIMRYDQQGKPVKRYKCINPVSGKENPVVFVLFVDSKKTLWATTLRQGNQYGALYYYNPSADNFEAFDTDLSDLFAINEDKNGTLWAGNLNKLVKIDRLGKKHQYYLLDHTVRAVFEDKRSNLWIGTEGGGLLLFDRKLNKVTARFTTADGLCNNAIINILADSSGNLWMSTLNGLSKFDPVTKKFKNYYYNDGLQSNQFNYNAALQLRSGEFAFGGIKGFNLFRPAQISTVNSTPSLAITNVKVKNTALTADNPFVVKTDIEGIKEIKLPYDDAVLSFDFAALEYSAPEKIEYAYYLEGWDRNWNYTGNLRAANYTHLTEGKYKFHVRNTNIDGKWSDKEMVINIIVLPPWYRSWWAILAYVLLTGSILYVFWLYRTRQTRLKYEIELARVSIEKEKIEKEKHRAEYEREKTVREAEQLINEKEKELNAKRQDFFTSITHEFRTPLTLIINPVRDLLQKNKQKASKDGEMNIIYRNARRLLSLVDQLLFFQKTDSGIDKVRPVRLNFYNLCMEVYLCFVQQAKLRHIEYEFYCDNKDLELYADAEKLEIIFYNLLSNAIKYTPDGGRIQFKIEERSTDVSVMVEDSGSGIPKEIGDKLFDKFYQAKGYGLQTKPGFGIGLYLVKQLVGLHKGMVLYESVVNSGTSFYVILKKGKEHFETDQVSDELHSTEGFIKELIEVDQFVNEETFPEVKNEETVIQPVITGKKTMLIVDDDKEIRSYVAGIFNKEFHVLEAGSGKEGLKMAEKHQPDMIISDIKMEDGDGIDFCKAVKSHETLSHVPVILLTGTHTPGLQLEGVEGGADDYITKPFEKDLLIARVNNLERSRANLQKYFFNEITLKKHDLKISEDDKEFLERCIAIVEEHLEDDEFTIVQLAASMGRSYSSVYKRIRMISGQSLKGFVRFVRLRKAAELFINSNYNVSEVAFRVGIYDAKFFREQFQKLFGLKPSEYIKKYRKPFQGQYSINPESGL